MDKPYSLNWRTLLIASMHRKEDALIPVLTTYFPDLRYHVATNIDTDQFGTFSGEKKRVDTMEVTVKKKALDAIQKNPWYDLVCATEWSFVGEWFWWVRHVEYIILIDLRAWYTFLIRYTWYVASAFSLATHEWRIAEQTLCEYLSFPAYGVIMSPHRKKRSWSSLCWWPSTHIVKGITDLSSAKETFCRLQDLAKEWIVVIESDFRAMYHPWRMEGIQNATKQLCEQICMVCPQCDTPWWRVQHVTWSARCRFCGLCTTYPTHEVWWCCQCTYTEEKCIDTTNFPLDSCPLCNP